MQLPGQGECHSEEASLLLEAGIISGTEFLKTDFSGQIQLAMGQIPIYKLTFILVEIAGTVANEETI